MSQVKITKCWSFQGAWPMTKHLLLSSHSVVSDSLKLHGACQASLSLTISQSLLKLMSTELMMPSNHPIFCCHIFLLPSVFPSIRVSSSESALPIKWPKYWSFRFRISSSSEYSGLISFRMDWLDILAVRGTLKSLLQHQIKSINSLALSLLYSPTLSSYMTTGNP